MKTKKAVFLALALLVALAALPWQRAAAGTRYYVKQGGTGNGTSWADASPNLKAIMDSADSGDEIWVAAGTYSPGGNKTDTFLLEVGVMVYGGFAGTEDALSQRDLNNVNNKTTLNGGNNAYHVVKGGLGATADFTRLDGFTITGGNANGFNDDAYGGGMYNKNSSPTVANCVFTGNTADGDGGGMYNSGSSPAVENCVFSGNTVNGDGGGMCNSSNSSPAVKNCAFSGNTANFGGGGGMDNNNSSPTVVNCTFSGNTADWNGGGMDNDNSSPTVVNCTFSKNTADDLGGGMYNSSNSSPTVANTILWGNTAANDSSSADIYQNGNTITLKNCAVEKCSFGGGGQKNETNPITGDPDLQPLDKDGNILISPYSATAVYIYGLDADGVPPDSSALNAGLPVGTVIKNDIRVPATDQRGVPRKPAPAAVDIGAYETVDFYTITNKLTHITSDNPADYRLTSDTTDYQAILTATQGTLPADITVKVGGTVLTTGYTYNSATGALSIDAASITGNIEIEAAAAVAPIAVTGVSLNKTITALTVGNSETLTATVEPADASNKAVTWVSDKPAIATVNNGVVTGKALGKAVITVTTQDGSFQATCTVIVRGTEPKIWYVKEGGAGNRDASDWANAAANLKDIMDIAESGDQVWVAAGTYSPGGDVTDTFLLKQGLKVYGGFAGGETDLSARNWVSNVTTLNGNSKNRHVVTGGTDATSDDTRLDGFTITGGNANGTGNFTYNQGGGMFNHSSSPTVANCVFSGNTANSSGGGMFNYSSSPTVTSCTFSGNTANNYGGGMYNYNNSSPTVTDCTFSGNTVTTSGGVYGGGGMFNDGSSPTVKNCAFSGNSANQYGGGMFNYSSSPTVTNCTLSDNTATLSGGGMYNYNNSSPTVENCAFSGNSANQYGGGMFNTNKSSPTVKNCAFSGNSANQYGGGMSNYSSSPTVTNCTLSDNTATLSGGGINNLQNASPILANTILWGNTAPADKGPDIYQDAGTLNLKNCVVEKYKLDNVDENISNLITGDPKLKALNKAGGNPATAADVYIYKLQTGSSAIDAGLPVGDIGNGVTVPSKDQRDITRPQGAGVDIGSYEAEYTITSVAVNPDTVSVKKGETKSFTANVTGTGDYNNTVTWSVIDKTSSGTTISGSGTLAVAADENATTLTVKATSKGDSAIFGTATVTVKEAVVAVTEVTVTPATLTLTAGGATETLTATVLPAEATNKDVTWASNNEAVATVANGVVTPIAAGQAIITVKTVDGNYQATCTVNVNAATVAVTGVTVAPETLTLTAGGATGTLTATVLPADATNKNVTWASSNEAIATVADGVVTPIAAGQAIITVKTVDGGKTATCTVTVSATAVPVTGVKLNKNATALVVGGMETLYATVEPATATNRNVTWSSDKPAIATVDNGGKVTAVGVGQATITVKTDDGNKTAACQVTVSATAVPVTGVKLNKNATALVVGGTETLYATVEPATATNRNVTWSSDKPAVVTVDAAGRVTAVGVGQATITVKTDDGNKTAACKVTVSATAVPVTDVKLNKASTALVVGGMETLYATVEPATATNRNVTWSSDKPAVATVDAAGRVTAVGVGQATITVKTDDGNKTAACKVTVSAAAVPVTGVKLNKASTTLVVGGMEMLYATIEPPTATNRNVTWSSDKPAVATVDAAGRVTAVGVGQATITVKTDDGNKTAACTVTVSAAGAQYTTVSGDGQTHTRSDGEDLLLTVKRNIGDEKTFGLFRQMLKDGVPVAESNYTKAAGSLIIRLKSAWLDTLAAGLHHLSFVFEDGLAQASFTIRARPGSFEDVTTPSDSFTFTKRWQGGTGKSIDWTLYDEMDRVAHKLFNKKVVSSTEWRYNAWFDRPVSRYVVEKPVSGYKTRYENVGVYAGITDRCCDGGAIINYKIPKTGDEANLALWAGLALLGLAGISAVLVTGRRRRKGK
ncbi:MAG: Ig-like domain-containing protein [Christensenellales bacterium]